MPGITQLYVPVIIHHVMARGIEGRDIFNDDDDWGMFLLIFRYCARKIYAYSVDFASYCTL
jgi:hypothetical protein